MTSNYNLNFLNFKEFLVMDIITKRILIVLKLNEIEVLYDTSFVLTILYYES